MLRLLGVTQICRYICGAMERHWGPESPPGPTTCCCALQNSLDVKTVSSMLGHYSAGFTLDTYAHVTTDAQLKAAQTMGSILSRAV